MKQREQLHTYKTTKTQTKKRTRQNETLRNTTNTHKTNM